ncbi:hypothetical protein BgiBS90_006809, partial [Biomphalaria glabrata]
MEKQYIVIRLGLRRLQSQLDAVYINAYNQLLGTWKANMDIQYVLCENACASYIALHRREASKMDQHDPRE